MDVLCKCEIEQEKKKEEYQIHFTHCFSSVTVNQVSNPASGGPPSCGVLSSNLKSHTSEPANHGLQDY